MIFKRRVPFILIVVSLLLSAARLQAQYERVQVKVYGLDCELCARGVAASIMRLDGVQSVQVHLKEGMLDVLLKSENNFKMGSLRKRIQDNGFRSMEATILARGRFDGRKFEVLGTGESYDVSPPSAVTSPMEMTFETRR